MAVATLAFWLGRNKFVHVPPSGMRFFRETFSGEGLGAVTKLIGLYAFTAVFWALYDQTHTAWVLQADKMNRVIPLGFTTIEPHAAQLQAINPVLVMIMIPLFSLVLYPAVSRYICNFTPLRRIGVGFFLMVPAYLVTTWIESQLTAGLKPHIIWQLLAYIVLTASEVMVSITALEFSYTQAPKSMKSLIMSLNLLSVSAGNFFVSKVNTYIKSSGGDSGLEGANYYLFFSGVMLAAAVLFVVYASFYRGQTYIQDEQK